MNFWKDGRNLRGVPVHCPRDIGNPVRKCWVYFYVSGGKIQDIHCNGCDEWYEAPACQTCREKVIAQILEEA